jgi:WD40 repeat protein
MACAGVAAALGLRPAFAYPKEDRPTSVVVVPAGIVSGGHNTKVQLWDPANLATPPQDFKIKHAKKVTYVAASATKLFSASYDGKVAVSDLANLNAKPDIVDLHTDIDNKAEVWVVVPSADGQRALSASNHGDILYWNVANRTLRGTYRASTEWVAGLAFIPKAAGSSGTPQEDQFISTHEDGKVLIWNIDDTVMPPTKVQSTPTRTFSHGNLEPVNCVAITRDNTGKGKYVVSGSFDKTIRIWDLSDPDDDQAGITIDKHTDLVWRVAVSPNNDKIASAGDDGTIRVFDTSGKPFRQPAPSTDEAVRAVSQGGMGVAFVNQTTIAYTTGDSDNPLATWDISMLQAPVP